MASPEKNLSGNTVRAYTGHLTRMAAYLGGIGIQNVENANVGHLRSYLADRKAGLKSKTVKSGINTIHSAIAAIKGFFKWAVTEGLITADPASILSAPKIPKTAPRFITEQDFAMFLRACDTEERELFRFMAGTGARRHEVMNVLVKDVVFGQKVIYIRGKGQKERVNPFVSRSVFKMIKNRIERLDIGPNDPVFDYTADHISYVLKRTLRKKRFIEKGLHFSPHTLRRLFADSLLGKVSLNAIQVSLGHSSIQTTTIYLNTSTKMMMKERKKMEECGVARGA